MSDAGFVEMYAKKFRQICVAATQGKLDEGALGELVREVVIHSAAVNKTNEFGLLKEIRGKVMIASKSSSDQTEASCLEGVIRRLDLAIGLN